MRAAGARLRFISDGDVAGAIMAARPDTGVDLLLGIGGTPEGIITACAIKCLGGVIQARLAPTDDEERQRAIDAGHDLDAVLSTNDLVRGENCFFVATGITDGELLKGVRYARRRGDDPLAGDAVQERHRAAHRRPSPDQQAARLQPDLLRHHPGNVGVSEVRTLVLGEALIDVVRSPDGAVAEHPGGSPANVALGLARLGHPVSLRTSIGSDDRGALIAAHLEPEGVELAAGSRTDGPTSVAEAIIDATGAATYRFELGWEVASPVSVDGATHLHTGSIAATLEPGATAVLDAVERARTGATVSYDPNARPSLMGQPQDVRAKIEQIIGLSDVVKASDEDVHWLYDGAAIPEVMRLWDGSVRRWSW